MRNLVYQLQEFKNPIPKIINIDYGEDSESIRLRKSCKISSYLAPTSLLQDIFSLDS